MKNNNEKLIISLTGLIRIYINFLTACIKILFLFKLKVCTIEILVNDHHHLRIFLITQWAHQSTMSHSIINMEFNRLHMSTKSHQIIKNSCKCSQIIIIVLNLKIPERDTYKKLNNSSKMQYLINKLQKSA
jgi:hypothetical protein